MDMVRRNMGWIEVIVGPMFSGKSEELIRRLRRAEIARQRVQIFKPVIDRRYAQSEIVSHSGLGIGSDNVVDAPEVLQKVQPRTEVIGIDEAQFLGEALVDVCTELANAGKRVIVSGWIPIFLAGLSSRCRVCWRWPRRSPSSWRFVFAAGIRLFTRSGWWPRKT